MVKLTVYDPALCCSTGVCGPEVDPVLVRFAADLEWLRSRGAEVRRYNLAQEAAAFARSPLVRGTLQAEGTDCLPLLLAGEEVVSSGRYPAREELAAWSRIDSPSAAAVDRPGIERGDSTRPGPTPPGLVVLSRTEDCDDQSAHCC